MKIKEDHQEIAKSGLSSASKGAAITAASSIVSGVAMTTTPGPWWLFGYGASTAVAGQVVLTAAVIGAATFGAVAAIKKYNQVKRTKKLFEDLGG